MRPHNSISYPAREDYLCSLEEADRSNVLRLLNSLKKNLTIDDRIIAIGGSVRFALNIQEGYQDMDLKVVGSPNTVSSIGEEVYSAIKQSCIGDISGKPYKKEGFFILSIISKLFPYDFTYVTFRIFSKPKHIDLLISTQDNFESYADHMRDKNKPFVILH